MGQAVEVVIVLGSANSQRLAGVAKEAGVRGTYLVGDADDIDPL